MNKPVEQARQLLECFHDEPGFQPRPQQAALAARLAESLEAGGQVLLEAPTGTGKTLACLCGGLALARAADRKLVIATSALNLQHQLLEQELARFGRVTGLAFHYALAKGRGRYACISRLQTLAEEGNQASLKLEAMPREATAAADEPDNGVLVRRMLKRLEQDAWSGDLDDWMEPLPAGFERHVASTRESCTGSHCEHYRRCAFQRMRRRVLRADVVVTNHALLLSDLELGGGRVLPAPESCLFIIDEAHGLPRQALIQAARHHDPARMQAVLKLARRLDREVAGFRPLDEKEAPRERQALFEAVETANEQLLRALRRSRFVQGLRQRREAADPRLLPGEALTGSVADRGRALLPACQALRDLFGRHLRWLQECPRPDGLTKQQAAWLLLQVPMVLHALEQAIQCWQLFLAEDPEEGPPIARWLEVEPSKRVVRPVLRVAPAWAADRLQKHLWEQAWGVALVSATLRALGSFEHYRWLAGLDGGVPAFVFEPAFDCARQARLMIPWMERVPGAGEEDAAFFAEVATILPALLAGKGGSLVLFNARHAMRQVYRQLPAAFRGRVLMQDNGLSRAALLQAHREQVAAGRPSVLFGLASLAEGVDLPGDLCRHVVITRLPFQPFTHPVARNLRDWLGREHFWRFSLPQASIRLIQACGRLLRGEEDRGQITILDRRLLLKRYGRMLLRHLPPYALRVENSALEAAPEVPLPAATGAGGTLVF